MSLVRVFIFLFIIIFIIFILSSSQTQTGSSVTTCRFLAFMDLDIADAGWVL